MTAPCPTFGFFVIAELRRELSEQARGEFRELWRAFLERQGLYSLPRHSDASDRYVVVGEGAQATDADRLATEEWLATRSELAAWRVSRLGDVRHPGG